MKQALHIFRKDISYLRYDITITLLAVLAFTITAIRHSPALGMLLPITWWFLIARLIHAEALAGHRQYWLTRPYAWKSLLSAKVLFILVFVNLPLLLADAVIIRAVGFSIGGELPGLLWTQMLLIAAFILPAAAFSAITSGLAELLMGTLILIIGIVGWQITGWWIHWDTPWFELDWVRTYCLMAQLAAAAAIILLWQYARRKTFATRLGAGIAVVILVASSALLPWTTAFALQTQFSQRNIAATSIHIELDSQRKWLGRIYPADQDQIAAELPLRITGIPIGDELRPNGLTLTLRAADGETWIAHQPPPNALNYEAGITSLRAVMDSAFYQKVKDQPLQLRGTLFFTLYGNKQITPIPLNADSVRVNDIAVCSATPHFLGCNSAFRTPVDLVNIYVVQNLPTGRQETTQNPLPVSYSPFPADLNLNPLSQFSSPYTDVIAEAHIEARAPLAYLERNFEIDDVHLHDFAVSLR